MIKDFFACLGIIFAVFIAWKVYLRYWKGGAPDKLNTSEKVSAVVKPEKK